ncbi:MAG: OmpH family outer membrane protein [Desulfuromonadaceae bacterium]|nr:OmpH family outer membrane protein [Desulfuromonadaceae bacterium]MDD5106136.1 OmpH family outer membrane protein [Desulfuromonadaceae bacterium]
MTTLIKRTLIAYFLILPTIAGAATDVTPATPPLQTTAPTTTEAAQKPAATVQAARIGYVDVSRIGTESAPGKALMTLLTTRKEALQKKIDGKKKQLEKLKASVEAKIATMTPAQREAKAKEFQKKLEELQKLAQTSEKELYTLQEKETKKLYEALEQAAIAYGAANGYSAIVIKKELLYVGNSADAQDVTNALIKALDQPDLKK